MEMLENSFTVVIGLIIGGLILAKYFMKKSTPSIPIFAFPPDRRDNFNIIRKDRLDRLKFRTGSDQDQENFKTLDRTRPGQLVQFAKKGRTL